MSHPAIKLRLQSHGIVVSENYINKLSNKTNLPPHKQLWFLYVICVFLVCFVTEPGILSIAAGLLSALVILLVLGVAVVCSQMRKKNNKPKGTEHNIKAGITDIMSCDMWCHVTLNMMCLRHSVFSSAEEDNEQEVTYADVRIMQRQERQAQQTAEVEMEYSHVKFPARSRQSVAPTTDDCVYAQVRRGRWFWELPKLLIWVLAAHQIVQSRLVFVNCLIFYF